MPADEPRDSAGITVPPPAIFFAPLLASLLANRRLRSRLLPRPLRAFGKTFGWLLILLALPLLFWTERTMSRAGATINPYTATENLATDGAFRVSRNPAYLSAAAIYIGVSLVGDSLPSAALFPVVIRAMNRGVIEREEQYLKRKFGARYTTYAERVGRWL